MRNLILFFVCAMIIYLKDSDAQVSQQWASFYNSPTNGIDKVNAMAVDNNNNVYVTGVSSSSMTGKDYATVMYNSSGGQQWSARYNSQSNFTDDPRGIAADASGNVYVTGVNDLGGFGGLIRTIKYNSAGIQQWAARCGDSVFSAGLGHFKSPIALDNSGNIYVGGSIKTYQTDDGSFLLIKYDPNGDSVWRRTFDPSIYPQGLGSGITCLKIDGNFIYAAGKSYNTDGLFTLYTSLRIIKYDLNGNTIWMSNDSLVNGSDNVVGMDIDPSGNVFVTCNYGLDILTFKFNALGTRLWKKIYSGIAGDYYDIVSGISADQSGNVIVTGNSRRSSVNNDDDYVTLKYDANGNLLWEKFYNGTMNSSDYSYAVTTDASDNVYVTGYSLETGFNLNAVTVKYNSAGVQQWNISFDAGNNENADEANAIAIDGAGNIIIAGYAFTPGNNEDLMTVKYSQTVGISQTSSQIPGRFFLSQNYPNPFNPKTKLEFGISKSGFVSLKIYDMTGKEIAALVNADLNPGVYNYGFDAGDISSGIYFYKLTTGGLSETKKMILIK